MPNFYVYFNTVSQILLDVITKGDLDPSVDWAGFRSFLTEYIDEV